MAGMPPLLILLKIVIPAVFVFLAIVSWRLYRKFSECLRTRHDRLYANLIGSYISVYRSPRYLFWFWSRGFDSIDDSEAAVLGSKITGLSLIAIALLLVWVACAWWGGYFHAR
jgi:hypothetical protein